MVLMVTYQKAVRGKSEELKELNRKWNAVDERLGLPPQKEYSCMFGGHDSRTWLYIVEWESMAAIEAGYQRFMADPEAKELMAQVPDVVESTQYELYAPLE